MDGRKNFTGPRINLDDLANGETVGIPIAGANSHATDTNGYAKDPIFAQGNGKSVNEEDDLPAGIFGRGEMENQVYDTSNRLSYKRPKNL